MFTNRAIESILGYSVDQFLQIESLEMLDNSNKESVKQTLTQHIGQKTGWRNWTMSWRHKDGNVRYLESNADPIFDLKGELTGFRGVDRDITDRKKAAEELQIAKEKAEESDHLKTAFLQNMSHEIRTPMNAISGFADLLNNPDLTPEKRKSFTAIIMNSSNQLLSIVNDILTISALDTHQERVNAGPASINNIIIDLLTIFKQKAHNQNISIYSKQGLTDKKSEILTDSTKLTQILSNLITNALKFTHEGFIQFGYTLKDKELEFFIKDSGIGIRKEVQDKILNVFGRLTSASTENMAAPNRAGNFKSFC